MKRILALLTFTLISCTGDKTPVGDLQTVAPKNTTPPSSEKAAGPATLIPQDGLDSDAKKIGDRFQQLVDSRHAEGEFNKRAVFAKTHTCARGTITVPENLPEQYRVGLFSKPGIKDIWLRVSSDTEPEGPDPKRTSDFNKLTIGFAVKVLGADESSTQDFLVQNHHVFFVDTAKDFMEFTEAAFTGKFSQYMTDHPTTAKILDDMNKDVANIRDVTFWSTTPYKFGDQNHVKYKVVPNTSSTVTYANGVTLPCSGVEPEAAPGKEEHTYLRNRLQRDLLTKATCFDFQVQLKKGDMPIDKATVEWSETESVPQTVAVIKIYPQNVIVNDDDCENLSFMPGHSLAAHQPVGSVNLARVKVYKKLSESRRSRNGAPITEPKH